VPELMRQGSCRGYTLGRLASAFLGIRWRQLADVAQNGFGMPRHFPASARRSAFQVQDRKRDGRSNPVSQMNESLPRQIVIDRHTEMPRPPPPRATAAEINLPRNSGVLRKMLQSVPKSFNARRQPLEAPGDFVNCDTCTGRSVFREDQKLARRATSAFAFNSSENCVRKGHDRSDCGGK